MTKLLLACCLIAAAETPRQAVPVVGEWGGMIDAGGVKLRIALHVTQDAKGGLRVSLDSLDQAAKGLGASIVTLKGKAFHFQMNDLDASFDGLLSVDGKTIRGQWTQGGQPAPLVFHRSTGQVEIARPQNPKKPYPYNEEEIVYENRSAHVKLAGTLTTPRGKGPFPVALLITGSGPQDRDSTLYGHKPFLVIADHLTRLGIAVLRLDDRGVGKSTGDLEQSTEEDLAGDVLTGVEWLKGRKDIDARKIGFIGHSEGGIVAAMAAARSSDVAFVVSLGGPGIPGEQLLYLQGAALNRAMGASVETIEKNRAVQEQMFAIVKREKDNVAAERELRALTKKVQSELSDAERSSAGQGLEDALNAQIRMVLSRDFRFFLTYDPGTAWRQVKAPVLALNGALDRQVPASENLSAITAALAAGGNPDYEIASLPKLNHLFQKSETGSFSEYGQLEETFAPVALRNMSDWILRHVR